jgi:pyruvate/2-oxoglutarate dehydrogenase complex dihydrolipoamide dehydrogenase (E3) component
LSSETAFDLIVIGTGTAGSTAAAECRSKGWRVPMIDSLPFGGTCALRGCDPSSGCKMMGKVSTVRTTAYWKEKTF